MRFALALVSMVLSLGLAAPVARACSCSIDPGPAQAPASPWFSASGFPSNGVFTSSLEWRELDGTLVTLERDGALSDALGFDARRPVPEVEPGTVLFPTDDCPARGECRHALIFGEADVTPPGPAELVDVTVQLADGAPESGTSCQVDELVLEVAGSDDVTPEDELVTVMFVGATIEEASSVETFALGMAYDAGPPSRRLVSTIVLGGAEGHRRDGGRLPESGAFCFTVALMDWAGNVGPRSEARCVDTRDPADPATQLVAYDPPCSGPFCAALPGRRAPAGALALLAGAALLARARRRRAPLAGAPTPPGRALPSTRLSPSPWRGRRGVGRRRPRP